MLERYSRPVQVLLARHFATATTVWPVPYDLAWASPMMEMNYTKGKQPVWMRSNSMSSHDMKNESSFQSRLLYRVLRALAGTMVLISSGLITFACIAALFGDQELLIEFIDEDASSLVLNVPTILAIVLTNVMALVALGLLFFSLNRFLNQAQRGELLVDPARKALRRLGVALVLLFVTTRSLAVVIPSFGIPGFWQEHGMFIPLAFLDLDLLYLLVGVVLLVSGQAIQEGQVAKEEAKQYV